MVLEKRITNDGSITFYNPEVDETYHSNSGAAEEAREKYAHALRLQERAKKADSLTIIDFCFGLGYNTAAAIDSIRKVHPECRITVIGLESDRNILDQIPLLPDIFHSFPLIRKAIQSSQLTGEENNCSLQIVLGDARTTVMDIPKKWSDIVLFDPFSPKKMPELWTTELFKTIFFCMKQGGALATYSCARQVRNNMKEAGFRVTDGPCIGRRSPSTLAYRDT